MPALEEVNAYWFYKQEMYDSAAFHLEKALDNSIDLQQKARSEYLLGQLYEMNKDRTKAIDYYTKSIRHTTDPLMDIYANLNMAKMYDSTGGSRIDVSVANLLKMAKRDKFDNYRDIIYYSAAEIILEKPDTASAIAYLKRSLFYSASNPSFKNRTFLKLADLSFLTKQYKQAYASYDSLQAGDSTIADWEGIEQRKNMLALIPKTFPQGTLLRYSERISCLVKFFSSFKATIHSFILSNMRLPNQPLP
jgi:tetratricopeptide (TPR) repeat protein